MTSHCGRWCVFFGAGILASPTHMVFFIKNSRMYFSEIVLINAVVTNYCRSFLAYQYFAPCSVSLKYFWNNFRRWSNFISVYDVVTCEIKHWNDLKLFHCYISHVTMVQHNTLTILVHNICNYRENHFCCYCHSLLFDLYTFHFTSSII